LARWGAGQQPALDRKRTRISEAFVIRDIFAKHSEVKNSQCAPAIFRLKAFRSFMREVSTLGHIFGMHSRHAAKERIPGKRLQTVSHARFVCLVKSGAFNRGCVVE